MTIKQALQDIKNGKMIIITDSANRENEADLVMAAEKVTSAHINFMATHGRGLICFPITKQHAQKLDIPLMVEQNTESHKTKFTVSIDAIHGTTTGISADDRALTIRKALQKDAKADDFRRPGHVFPIIAEDMGVLQRAGHTEAAVDIARCAGLQPAGVICEIMNEDGTMMREDIKLFAEKHHLNIISIDDIKTYRIKNELLVEKIVETKLPTEFGEFQLLAFKNKINDTEEFVLLKKPFAPFVRIHSECFTSEVLGSLRCDCDEQLKTAMSVIGKKGGMIIYLRQEGRGIGLLNKLHAYTLQDKGYDTFAANEQLGFAHDEREYSVAYQILKYFNLKKITLLSNNPDKKAQLEKYGIEVTQMPIGSVPTIHNKDYLLAKKQKGHLLDVDEKLIFI
ncbi:MAG TPA: 3,4-dihydroxy-2-butanone-4-phosphate synthase [Candidatus Nanoarchaeia archaeon]|nr:3,4-dihydroxy-2-butanone-4-phosphate synthase [Candidatus Nanoarchaeia archaeon]